MNGLKKSEESFKKLKAHLTTTPILALSLEGKDFIIYFNYLDSCLGIMLMQDKNVIAYTSHQLNIDERNHPNT